MTIRAPLLFALVLLAAACAEMKPSEKPQPPAPQITEDVLRARAKDQLAQGQKQYDAGDYENAVKNLTASLDHGLLSKTEQSTARKTLAFIYCVSNRESECRDQFRKAFEINPEFALTPAEDGHPIWGPVYRSVRAQLIAEREASMRQPAAKPGKAEQMLADGLVKYDAGEYADAEKTLQAALKEGLKDRADQVRAMKHVAFCLCLQRRYPQCRAEFLRIFDVDPQFDLTPAEVGHPSWTHTFAAAKRKAQHDRAAKDAREKAAAPKKD